jgi:putative membrane protein
VNLLLRVGLNALAIWVAVQVVGGLDFVGEPLQLVLLALVMGVVNVIVKPIVKLLSFPLVLLTLGLFLIAINVLMFAIVVGLAGPLDLGLSSDGFSATALGALVASVVVWVGDRILPD